MRLSRQLKSFVVAHAFMGIVQIFALYLLSGVASYGGDAGFLAYTPIGQFFEESEGRVVEALALPSLFAHIVHIGDALFGLASFEYEVLTSITKDDGVWFWLVNFVRVATWVTTAAAGEAVVEKVFQSGLLSSGPGLAIVLGGASVTGVLGIFGAVN